jgi:Family of unknown function (DUF5995)
MRMKRLACLVAAAVILGAGDAPAQSTGLLPPDPTVPYLPAVAPVLCANGEHGCVTALAADLGARTEALGCDHAAVFSDAYVTITRAIAQASGTPGFFARPDRVNHEARTYAQEYFDQYQRWHADPASASPAWQVAFRAARDQSVTALGDLMLALNAHIRRDNPIRALEQAEGVLRVPGRMPAASGKPDHERVNTVLADAMDELLAHLAQRYDPTIDDGTQVLGSIMDPRGTYVLIAAWREESWRNAEQLRHARAAGGVHGILYRAKLAQIEASAKAGADLILAATRTTPQSNAARNAYCEARS